MKKPIAPGTRFGRYEVIREDGRMPRTGTAYLCRCDCGAERRVSASQLRFRGDKHSGCVACQREARFKRSLAFRAHRRGQKLEYYDPVKTWDFEKELP